MAERISATPEKELGELRRRQQSDRSLRERVEKRIKERDKRIKALREDLQMLDRLDRAHVLRALDVMLTSDRCADATDLPVDEFRAMCLTILKKETGFPQRAIFGCDHGARSGPPYCHQPVTHETGTRFIKALHDDPWAMMNGVHWTQTTWYEKVYRVEKLSADLTAPVAHMTVCFGDLAILRREYGVREAFRRYNGSGPAAEQYANDAMALMPGMTKLVKG